jgi:hypothetical protein
MNINAMQNAISEKVNGSTQPVLDQEAFEKELARLKAEREQILSSQAAPKPAATPAPSLAVPQDYSAADRKLLEILAQFRSPARADGKVSGTFAVKVHSYFHSCGISEEKTREIVAAARKRNVISTMTVPTKNGNRMMLYFDARERPNFGTGEVVPASEKAAMAALFGGQ